MDSRFKRPKLRRGVLSIVGTAASDKIAFDKLSSDWDLDGSRASERWWFA